MKTKKVVEGFDFNPTRGSDQREDFAESLLTQPLFATFALGGSVILRTREAKEYNDL